MDLEKLESQIELHKEQIKKLRQALRIVKRAKQVLDTIEGEEIKPEVTECAG